MSAGELDRRIQFRRAALIDDGYADSERFADHGTPVWAKKRDVSDGERWRAAEVSAQITSRFKVRWGPFTSGITPKDQLVCEGVTYAIVGIKEVGRRRYLEITAAARIDLDD